MISKNHVPALNISYWYNCLNGVLIFEDGVEYTLEEALMIARRQSSDDTIQALHLIKKEFKGTIIEDWIV